MNDDHTPLQECIRQCWNTRYICQKTLYHHCLLIGRSHMEGDHVKLMTDCIEICQTAADFMTRDSTLHARISEICAEVCNACAKACEEIGDDAMMYCAEMCRNCAKSCRATRKAQEAA